MLRPATSVPSEQRGPAAAQSLCVRYTLSQTTRSRVLNRHRGCWAGDGLWVWSARGLSVPRGVNRCRERPDGVLTPGLKAEFLDQTIQ